MAMTYKHGTYGEFAKSIAGAATQAATIPVYVGTAPVNLIRGYADGKAINTPVLLRTFDGAAQSVGYSADWASFTLGEAVKAHFDNPAGNVGPIVVVNVLDPVKHKKVGEATTSQLTFANGRATIESDTIILDTLVLAEKVEGVDFSVDYDFENGIVIIDSIGEKLTDSIQATYSEVDPSLVTEEDIIGGVTAGGEYSGLGAVALVYPELGLIPNIIAAPGWSDEPAVYNAMIGAGTKINGHWDAFVVADIPLKNSTAKAGRATVGESKLGDGDPVDTISAAIEWAEENGYNSERSKVCWPQAVGTDGNIYRLSTLTVWKMQAVDASRDGIPMETPSNKAVPITRQYFGEDSKNRGFDQQQGNELNAAGISTAVFWGGQWVLWGGHTAAYKFGKVTDNRVIFDNSIRMMMHITNSFQEEHAITIDQPMTKALADTIRNREQEKADALAAVGALIGAPEVRFDEDANSTAELVEGNFVWDFSATPTPQFKSGTLRVAYTDAGFDSYFGEEA